MSTESFIDNVILGDNIKAKTDFNTLLHDRSQAQIDGLKQQMAKDMFGELQQVAEPVTEPVEVDPYSGDPVEQPAVEAQPEVQPEVQPEAQPEAQPEVHVEESFDIVSELQTASTDKEADLHLMSGEVVPVDFKTANVVLRYMQTLGEEEKRYFLEDIVENERGLLKGIEQAFFEIGVE